MEKINQLRLNFEKLARSDTKAVNFFNDLIDAYLEKNATSDSTNGQPSSAAPPQNGDRYSISYSNNSALSIRHISNSETSNRANGCAILEAPFFSVNQRSRTPKSAQVHKVGNGSGGSANDPDAEIIAAIMRSNNNSCLTHSHMSGSAAATTLRKSSCAVPSSSMSKSNENSNGRFCPVINVPYVVNRKCGIGQIKVCNF
jgi:hypothetical protein